MQERRLTRVIDIGCGAGAFYALASRHIPGLEYYGLDASRAQVARARRNFPGVAFEVADAGALTREAIGQYEAAHLYSVLPFMAVTAQLRLLDEVLASGAAAVLQVEATCRGVYWVPRSTFRNLGKVVVDGRKLLSTVSLPYQREVDRIVSRHTAFEIDWSERSAAITQLINASGRAGGGFLVGSVKDIPKRRFARWWLRSDRRGRMLTGIIRPRGWCVPDSVVGPESLKDDCSSC